MFLYYNVEPMVLYCRTYAWKTYFFNVESKHKIMNKELSIDNAERKPRKVILLNTY